MRFAKAQEKKMGKPEQVVVKKREGPRKSPISKFWIGAYLTTGRGGIQWRGDTQHASYTTPWRHPVMWRMPSVRT
jgi:hypothetical protein